MITAENIDLSQRDGKTIPFGSTNGTTLGKSGDRIGFFGGAPTMRRSVLFAPVKKLCTIGAKAAGHSSGSVDWVVAAAANTQHWTCAASAGAAKLVVPVSGLNVGDKIVGFGVIGQIESGGNAATLDANLRKLTAAAAANTDASVASITQISVTADTAINPANGEKRHFSVTVTSSDTFYILITATTAASTDVDLLAAYVLVQPAGNVAATERRYFNGIAKAGATSGWVVADSTTTFHTFTLPQSQSGSTLILPLNGLRAGDQILGFNLLGQIDSAGNSVTLDAELRKVTADAAGPINGSIASMDQLVVTADTALTLANTLTTNFSATVAQNESYYLKLTATTGGTTDIDLMGVHVLIKPADNPQTMLLNAGGKVGGTSGFTPAGATNAPNITVAAGQTGAKLVVPITGLQAGDIITGMSLIGSVTSAGNNVTLDLELRKYTVAAADNVDSSIASMSQAVLAAAAELSPSNNGRSDLYYEIAADEEPYLLVTCTTAASTTLTLQGVQLTVHSSAANQVNEILRRLGLAGV